MLIEFSSWPILNILVGVVGAGDAGGGDICVPNLTSVSLTMYYVFLKGLQQ